MSIQTLVEVDGDRVVVVKRSSGAREQLRLEGERLRRASHPGVVQVVASGPVDDGWELRTAHAGRPLSILEPTDVPQAAAVVAALASTLADLHQLGVVHGRLDASHVLVGEQGRPVLCGFGDGTMPARAEDDVAALGGLLAGLMGEDHEAEPIPDSRWRRRRGWSGWERRALLLLADQACAEPATRRPTARRLAAAISEAVPDLARQEVPNAPWPHPPDAELDPIERLRASSLVDRDARTRGIPRTALALAAVGAVLLVTGVVRFARGGAPPEEMAEATEIEAMPTTSEVSERRTAAEVPGSVLTAEGRRYRVGQAGDKVLLDDWDCDGIPTPALLRPGTGEVFVFPRWIERAEVAVEPVLQVAGAEALVSEVTLGGCPTLAVRSASGDLVPVIEAREP